jgi:hypothetical protein
MGTSIALAKTRVRILHFFNAAARPRPANVSWRRRCACVSGSTGSSLTRVRSSGPSSRDADRLFAFSSAFCLSGGMISSLPGRCCGDAWQAYLKHLSTFIFDTEHTNLPLTRSLPGPANLSHGPNSSGPGNGHADVYAMEMPCRRCRKTHPQQFVFRLLHRTW